MEQKIKCSRDELGGGTAVSKAKWQATGNGQDVCSHPCPLMPTPRPGSMGRAGARAITGWNSSAGVSVSRGAATGQGQSELGCYRLLHLKLRKDFPH